MVLEFNGSLISPTGKNLRRLELSMSSKELITSLTGTNLMASSLTDMMSCSRMMRRRKIISTRYQRGLGTKVLLKSFFIALKHIRNFAKIPKKLTYTSSICPSD